MSQFQGMDKIVVSESGLKEMHKIFTENEAIVTELHGNSPLEEGVLVMQGEKWETYLTFKKTANGYLSASYSHTNGVDVFLEWDYNLKDDKITFTDRNTHVHNSELIYDFMKNAGLNYACRKMSEFLFVTFNYMNMEKDQVSESRESVRKTKNRKKGKASAKARKKVTYINNRVYTVSIPELTEERRQEYTRHIDSWRVRGFWRNYKSGKKVWARPHVRGEKKNKVVEKEYHVNP